MRTTTVTVEMLRESRSLVITRAEGRCRARGRSADGDGRDRERLHPIGQARASRGDPAGEVPAALRPGRLAVGNGLRALAPV